MTTPTLTQSQKRLKESVASLFSETCGKIPFLFLTSSSDVGVIRNGGRNGARFAPQSFLSTFKKFALTSTAADFRFSAHEVASQEEEKKNFTEAQRNEAQRIRQVLALHPGARFCHLGGGHDHVFPLLKALAETYAHIIVLNIDAHADTRTDDAPHSGTPFRQFAQEFEGQLNLFQIGLHSFANSSATLSKLPGSEARILWKNELSEESLKALFQEVRSLMKENTFVFFSLDADALCGHEVPGVSAVNPRGITAEELRQLWSFYVRLPLNHQPGLGIYELNPVYDSIASISMRTLGSFVFEGL